MNSLTRLLLFITRKNLKKLASVLLAIQDTVRAWLVRRMGEGHSARLEKMAWLPVGLASIYGGYFGAGLSVIVLSALGLTLEDSLTRLNALKQAVAFAVNVAAAIFFLFSGQVIWSAALVMAVGALIGAIYTARLPGRLSLGQPRTGLRGSALLL